MPLPSNLGDLLLRGFENAAQYEVGAGKAIGDAYRTIGDWTTQVGRDQAALIEKGSARRMELSAQTGAAIARAKEAEAERNARMEEAERARQFAANQAEQARAERRAEAAYADAVRNGQVPVERAERIAQLKGAAEQEKARRDAAARAIQATGIFDRESIDGKRAGVFLGELASKKRGIAALYESGDLDGGAAAEREVRETLSRNDVQDILSMGVFSANPIENQVSLFLNTPEDHTKSTELGRSKSEAFMVGQGASPDLARVVRNPKTGTPLQQAIVGGMYEDLSPRTVRDQSGKPFTVPPDLAAASRKYSAAKVAAPLYEKDQRFNKDPATVGRLSVSLASAALATSEGTGVPLSETLARLRTKEGELFAGLTDPADYAGRAAGFYDMIASVAEQVQSPGERRYVLDLVMDGSGNFEDLQRGLGGLPGYLADRKVLENSERYGVASAGSDPAATRKALAARYWNPERAPSPEVDKELMTARIFAAEMDDKRRVAAGVSNSIGEQPSRLQQLVAGVYLSELPAREQARRGGGTLGVYDETRGPRKTQELLAAAGVEVNAADAKVLYDHALSVKPAPDKGVPPSGLEGTGSLLEEEQARHRRLVSGGAAPDAIRRSQVRMLELSNLGKEISRFNTTYAALDSQNPESATSPEGKKILKNMQDLGVRRADEAGTSSIMRAARHTATIVSSELAAEVSARILGANNASIPFRPASASELDAAVARLRSSTASAQGGDGKTYVFRASDIFTPEKARAFLASMDGKTGKQINDALYGEFRTKYNPINWDVSSRVGSAMERSTSAARKAAGIAPGEGEAFLQEMDRAERDRSWLHVAVDALSAASVFTGAAIAGTVAAAWDGVDRVVQPIDPDFPPSQSETYRKLRELRGDLNAPAGNVRDAARERYADNTRAAEAVIGELNAKYPDNPLLRKKSVPDRAASYNYLRNVRVPQLLAEGDTAGAKALLAVIGEDITLGNLPLKYRLENRRIDADTREKLSKVEMNAAGLGEGRAPETPSEPGS